MVKETVAFGRHVDGPPKKVYTPPPSGTLESFGFDSGRRAFYPETLYSCRQTMPARLNRQLHGQNTGIPTSKALFFQMWDLNLGISVGRFFNKFDNLIQQAEPTLHIEKVNATHLKV